MKEIIRKINGKMNVIRDKLKLLMNRYKLIPNYDT